jgi:hypothetical protein
MISWLNSNAPLVAGMASAVSAFAATVVMFATLMTVRLNRRLARENRELRKAEGDPQVIAYVTINPRVFSALDFVIANIGKGAAKNISFKVVSGGTDLARKGVQLLRSDVKYSFVLAGQQLSSTMGMGFELLANPVLAPFEVEVTYENLREEKTTTRHLIDVSQFNGVTRLGQPFEEQIAESVKKIASAMESWRMSRLQVETMSVTERRQRDEQFRRAVEEERSQESRPESGTSS